MLSTSIDAYYDRLNSSLDGQPIAKEVFSWQGRTFLMIMLPTSTILQLGGFYMGRELSLQGQRKPIFLTFAGLRQNLFKNKLTISMMALAPFQRPKFTIINSDEHFNSQIEIQFLKPLVSFTVTYRLRNFREQFQHKPQDGEKQQSVPFMGQGIY